MSPGSFGSLADTMGVFFIGLVVAIALWGVSCGQVWHYTLNSARRDGLFLRLLVWSVFALDFVSLILNCVVFYGYVITNFDNPDHLADIVTSTTVATLLSGFIAFLVQSFFVSRVWRLSGGNIWITLVVVTCAVSALGTNFGYCIFAFRHANTASRAWTIALDMTQAITDLAIAAAVIMLLRNSRTDSPRTSELINRLMLFTLHTGLITALCAVATVLVYLFVKRALVYVALFNLLPQLYCNSLLATLNTRSYLRRKSVGPSSFSAALDGVLHDLTPANVGGAIKMQRQGSGLDVDEQFDSLEGAQCEEQERSAARSPELHQEG